MSPMTTSLPAARADPGSEIPSDAINTAADASNFMSAPLMLEPAPRRLFVDEIGLARSLSAGCAPATRTRKLRIVTRIFGREAPGWPAGGKMAPDDENVRLNSIP